MRLFLYFILIIILQNCTTVEVTKEIIKAGHTVKTSISGTDQDLKVEDIADEDIENLTIEKEKEIIDAEKSKQKNIVETQQNIANLNFSGNTINKIKQKLGDATLSRLDGNTLTLRYNTTNCRLFLFFNNRDEIKKVEYFELRNTSGNLIESKQDVETCYKEFNLIK